MSADSGGQGATVFALTHTVLEDPAQLARLHSRRAIECLAELMELRGRQAHVGYLAAKAMCEIAMPRTMDDAKVERLVEARFEQLVAEARKQLEARQLTGTDLPTTG